MLDAYVERWKMFVTKTAECVTKIAILKCKYLGYPNVKQNAALYAFSNYLDHIARLCAAVISFDTVAG